MMTIAEQQIPSSDVGLCRIANDDASWLVVVETWQQAGEVWGRLRFEPPGRGRAYSTRWSPAVLRGASREEVIAQAIDLPERRLRELLRSLA